QADGFGVAVGMTAQGIWSLGVEAPDWGLTLNESYTASLLVGALPYTSTGRAISTRAMTLNVATEIFAQLKSGVQLSLSANQHRYTMSLDGIEAATQRVKDCIREYGVANSTDPSSTPSPALVASIQTLLARL